MEDMPSTRLRNYMMNYLSIMMTISSVFLEISATKENHNKRTELWAYLKEKNEKLYYRLRYRFLGAVANPPGRIASKITIRLYRLARKIYKFN
jgi:hypothetical protein